MFYSEALLQIGWTFTVVFVSWIFITVAVTASATRLTAYSIVRV